MTWRTNAWTVAVRNLGRSLGLNKQIARYLCGPGYESRYQAGFLAALKMGDCVWDVGANLGYYTKLFSERIGSEGILFAFEPSPVNFARLNDNCSTLSNVRLLQVGLGRENNKVFFQQGSDDQGATSRVVFTGRGTNLVDIRSGMSLICDGAVSPPNAVKIDVEGFEYEVLQGLGKQLGETSLRAIGIEVHFGIFEKRGIPRAPQQIESLLQHYGLAVKWPDPSHILATRAEK